MPRRIIPPEEIDEEYLREMVGNMPPLVPADRTKEPSPTVQTPHEADSIESPPPSSGVRLRKVVLPDFKATFLKSIPLKYRAAVYVSEQTKEQLISILQSIGAHKVPVSRYIENILSNHIELFRVEIEKIRENNQKGHL